MSEPRAVYQDEVAAELVGTVLLENCRETLLWLEGLAGYVRAQMAMAARPGVGVDVLSPALREMTDLHLRVEALAVGIDAR